MKGELYIVATPIGNIKDITFRAIEIFKMVNFIFCEDTRTTGRLLEIYKIKEENSKVKLDSYNAINGKSKNEYVLKLLNEGKNIALISDAGTPAISDPGYSLINFIREYNNSVKNQKNKGLKEIKITPIPGASALTAFLSACGYGTNKFTFLGFLPHKKGRQTIIREILNLEHSSIFYESTHRILKCLEEIKNNKSKRKIVIGRELTKIYEEYLEGTAEEILDIFKKNPEKKKGEFVVMVV